MHPETDFPTDLRALEGDYELIREVGQGGMAAVYLARHRDTGKLVAIKAIRARYLDDPDAIQRFAREARTVADLDHPNIVRTEAIEEIGDRAVAIIMEYVPGGTVRDRLREFGAFSAEHAESVLRDVANALGYAHERGIVHRDVKPENVFLERLTGRALLSDFGIARRVEDDVQITLLGASLGTPQYMSPEQIDGGQVDGRTDIYSLGVLGWELLTGRRPWAGENLYGVIYKQKHEDLPRITGFRPRVPANLLFAIEGALEKDRTRRWQSVDEFLAQLTYNPPPVLSANRMEPGRPVGDEPTVRFLRVASPPGAEPNEAVPVLPPPPEPISFGQALPVSGRDPERRKRRGVLAAVALLASLAIAGVSLYALLSGRVPDLSHLAVWRADTSRVTSSAGTLALDTALRADSGRTERDTTSVPGNSPAPLPSQPDSSAAPLPQAAPPDSDSVSAARHPSAQPDTVARVRASPETPDLRGSRGRCRRAAMADQRACLLALVAANDVPLQRLYDSLIVELRRAESFRSGASDPSAVRRLRFEQRIWLAERDRECTRDPAPGYIPLWAVPISECFAQMSVGRRSELAASLDSLRRKYR
jgi:serine/threonine protein kinase/uncharacterized protein YecT (DUF1311 family)